LSVSGRHLPLLYFDSMGMREAHGCYGASLRAKSPCSRHLKSSTGTWKRLVSGLNLILTDPRRPISS
jgi:hypothetical protein